MLKKKKFGSETYRRITFPCKVIKIAKLFVGLLNCCASRCSFDYSCCFVEKPINAFKRLEEAFRRLDWQRRTILRGSMCSICRYCYPLMASGCYRSCARCFRLKLLPRSLQRSYCSSGLPLLCLFFSFYCVLVSSFEKERAKFPGRLALPGTCIRHISGFNF